MKTSPKSPEAERFTAAMRQIMSVSKEEMKRRDAEERAVRESNPYYLKRGPKPRKRASRAPAS